MRTHIVKSSGWKSKTAYREEDRTGTNKTKSSGASGRLYQQLTGKQRRGTVTYVTNGYLLDTERKGKFCVLQPRVLLKSPARY